MSRDEAVQLWIHILRNGLSEILQTNCDAPLKAEACSALATIGTQIFECLPVSYLKIRPRNSSFNFEPFSVSLGFYS